MLRTYTARTTLSVILCMLAVGNVAIQFTIFKPMWITPVLGALAVASGIYGQRSDPENKGVHTMTVRIGLGCAAISGLLSFVSS
ncbi:hypothetical protein ACFWJM_11095 [Streptomyces sp. NPDC127077]|uniref:hypothetical protein n=1 Tax=Streptomyces sp. NPDC127077 TaxID=3347131 RepID=UPI003661EEC6